MIKNLPLELAFIRAKYEPWRETASIEEHVDYFKHLLSKGLIVTHEVDGELIGYIEFWRMSYEEFGKYILSEEITFDCLNGPVCYVANTCIKPEFRETDAFNFLAEQVFELNDDAECIVGRRQGKYYKPLVVFKHLRKVQHG